MCCFCDLCKVVDVTQLPCQCSRCVLCLLSVPRSVCLRGKPARGRFTHLFPLRLISSASPLLIARGICLCIIHWGRSSDSCYHSVSVSDGLRAHVRAQTGGKRYAGFAAGPLFVCRRGRRVSSIMHVSN